MRTTTGNQEEPDSKAKEAMLYVYIKYVHLASIALSVAGFAARGALLVAGSPLLKTRIVRIVPHAVDTVLLASGAWLAWLLGPAVWSWLGAKLVGVVFYIVLGTFALRRGRTPAQKGLAFVAAYFAVAYVISVALTKDPRGFF